MGASGFDFHAGNGAVLHDQAIGAGIGVHRDSAIDDGFEEMAG